MDAVLVLAAQRVPDRIGRGGVRSFVDQLADDRQRFTLRVGEFPPGELLGGVVRVRDPAFEIRRDDRIADRFDGDRRVVELDQRPRMHVAALLDVGHRAGDANGAPCAVAHRASARAEPAVASGLRSGAELDVVGDVLADMGPDGGERPIAIVGMHERHECARRVLDLAVGVAQQILYPRRDVHFARAQIPLPEAVVAADHREMEALLAEALGRLERLALPQQPARHRDPDEREARRAGQRRSQKRDFGVARGFAEREGKGILERGEPGVDLADSREDGRVGHRVGPEAHFRVQRLRRPHELRDVAIALGPDPDRLGDVAYVAEPAEEPDHVRNVVRMIAAFEESLTGDFQVGARLLELLARLAIAQRDCDRLLVASIVAFGTGFRVAIEMVDRLLLRLRPQPFAGDVRPHGRQGVDARRAQQREQCDDGEERPDDPQKARTAGDQPGQTLYQQCPLVIRDSSRDRRVRGLASL